MKFRQRLISGSALAILTAFLLTACTPPMPPEVLASLAEKTYTCEAGTATVDFLPSMTTDITQGWADNLAYTDCATTMFLKPSYEAKGAGAIVSDYKPEASTCAYTASVPFAVDAGVLTYNLSGIGSLSLSKNTVQKILTGQITSWDASEIKKDNPNNDMPKEPIILMSNADKNALSAFEGWIFDGSSSADVKISSDIEQDSSKFKELAEGELAIVPNSFAIALGLYPASVLVGSDPNNSEDLANPDYSGIQSATTQLVAHTNGSSVEVSLDKNLAPTPPDGVDIVAAPYQAIYPVKYYLCQDNLLYRAMARYLLRLDSQGSLGSSNYTQLSEPVRAAALVGISHGLPTPKPTPTN